MPTDAAGRAFLAQKAQEPGVISRPSGLLYKYLNKGSGAGHPMPDTPCDFHYRGTLITGEEFDSSYKRGKPSEFTANGVVPGCTEGYQLMVEGDKVMFYIPSELAYGDAGIDGLIPSGAVLVFEVDLVKIKGPTKPKAGGAIAAPSAAMGMIQRTEAPAMIQRTQAPASFPQYAKAQVLSGGLSNYATPTEAQTYAQPAYSQAYAQPTYSQASYAQPTYSQQSAFAQPQVYSQSASLSPGVYSSASVSPGVYSQSAYGQPQVYTQGGSII
jgi:hypothetical protein